MKIHDVFPGRSYAVSCSEGCTVSTPDGVVICTAAAGQQAFFVAPCATVQVSDDSALVTQSFKAAPGMLPSAGGNSGFQPEGDYLILGDNFSSVEGRLDSVSDGSYLFYKKNITAFSIPLPNLTDGSCMFSLCPGLTSFSGDLPTLTNGGDMFSDCPGLTSWTVALPNLTNGNFMFNGCTGLTSWTVALPNLTNGYFMFNGCPGLTSWTVALPNLTDGSSMFSHCPGLTSFSGDLPALTNGSSMFRDCKLNLASVQNIASTIKDVSSVSGTHNLTLGMDAAIQGDEDLATALAAIRAKGWTVTEQYNS